MISTSIPESYFQKLQESNSLRNSINNWPKIPHKPKPQTPYIRDSPSPCRYTASGIEVPMANGNVIKIPVADSDINISEEMNKSGLWKSVDQGQNNGNGLHKNDG